LLTYAAPAQAQAPSSEQTERPDDETMIVLGERRGVTKLDVSIRELPQSVVDVSREVIEQRSIVRLEEIAEAAPGVRPTLPYTGGVSLGFFVRGFNGAPILVDGVNAGVTAGFTQTIQNLAFVENVEVLRGPASVLYGQGNPGGVVNLVLKRPRDSFGWIFDAELDSQGGRRLDLDVTGAPVEDISTRLIVSLEDSDTFRDFGQTERYAFAPSINWTPTDRLKLDVFYAYDRFRFNNDRGFGFDGSILALNIPVQRNLSEPDLALNEYESQTLRASAAYTLGRDWEAILAYSRYIYKTISAAEIGFLGPLRDSLIERYYQQTVDPNENLRNDYTISLSFAGSLRTGPLDHRIYVSAERVDSFFNFLAFAGTVDPIDALNPVYQSVPLGPTPDFLGQGSGSTKATAVYGQNLISIGDRVKVLVGGRLDSIDTGSAFRGSPDEPLTRTVQEDTVLTPRAGAVWEPIDGSSLFVNYSRSFLPQVFQDRLGAPLEPERARSIELGLRQSLFGERVALTSAIYQINRTGLVVTDPVDPNFSINGGEGRSRGAEFEFVADITPDWRINGGAAYTDAVVLQSDIAPVGETLPGASPWTATFFTRYDQPRGPFRGLAGFAGFSYASATPWVQPNQPPNLPAFFKLDLGIAYQIAGVELQGTVENVLDDRLILANGFGLTGPGAPRTFLLSLIWRGGSLKR